MRIKSHQVEFNWCHWFKIKDLPSRNPLQRISSSFSGVGGTELQSDGKQNVWSVVIVMFFNKRIESSVYNVHFQRCVLPFHGGWMFHARWWSCLFYGVITYILSICRHNARGWKSNMDIWKACIVWHEWRCPVDDPLVDQKLIGTITSAHSHMCGWIDQLVR